MMPGAITQQIDVAQLAVVVFFLFFLGLVYYLRREDKREGYPLDEPGPQMHRGGLIGFPEMPPVKTLHLLEGGTTDMPHYFPPPPIEARYVENFGGGEPLEPVGNPLLSAVGPAAWVMRSEQPLRLVSGELQMIPLRTDPEWGVREGEADPRGMAVFDSRWIAVGTVVDLWVDRSAKLLRYLEVELNDTKRRIHLPIYDADIRLRAREIRVTALRRWQFADIPGLAQPDIMTSREEDRINAYFAGGRFHEATAIQMVTP